MMYNALNSVDDDGQKTRRSGIFLSYSRLDLNGELFAVSLHFLI